MGFYFKNWLENTLPVVVGAKETPQGIVLKYTNGTYSAPVKAFKPLANDKFILLPSRTIVGLQSPNMSSLLDKYINKKPLPKTIDDALLWVTDGTDRNPPQGWEPAMMNLHANAALKAAYSKGLPPIMARKISEYVYIFSVARVNYDKRMLKWLSDQNPEMETSDLIDKKNNMQNWYDNAEKYHKLLMNGGYKLPPPQGNNGLKTSFFL